MIYQKEYCNLNIDTKWYIFLVFRMKHELNNEFLIGNNEMELARTPTPPDYLARKKKNIKPKGVIWQIE